MKKSHKILIITFVFALMITNVIFAIIFMGSDGANIFTAISGWISGIATIVLGLIAFWQNQQYKKQNDAYQEKIDKQNNDILLMYRKQNVISKINAEQIRFSEELSKLCSPDLYVNLVINRVFANDDDIDNQGKYTTTILVLMQSWDSFLDNIFTYNYFPISSEHLIEKVQIFKIFISKELAGCKFHDPADDGDLFKKEAKQLTAKVMQLLGDMLKVKLEVIAELQFLTSNFENAETLSELTEWENKIAKRTQDFRKKYILGQNNQN